MKGNEELVFNEYRVSHLHVNGVLERIVVQSECT